MSLSEFDLIAQYFKRATPHKNSGVALGIGDDCALLDVPDGYQLAVTTDSLVCGVHFFADVDAYRLGYKALAVNLSDLAAMGATPKWASLALTLPETDELWLAEFSRGFFELAEKFNVSLIGGDTTKGPLSITVSVKGVVPRGLALQRSAANAGDLICVSGNLGDGAVGLACKQQALILDNAQPFINALELTEPRIELGILLRGLASSCIDISDGLTQDLQHILNASHCSATLNVQMLPYSKALQQAQQLGIINKNNALQYALTGGDDYELLFTISAVNFQKLSALLKQTNLTQTRVSVIGTLGEWQQPILQLCDDKQPLSLSLHGWDHFKS